MQFKIEFLPPGTGNRRCMGSCLDVDAECHIKNKEKNKYADLDTNKLDDKDPKFWAFTRKPKESSLERVYSNS